MDELLAIGNIAIIGVGLGTLIIVEKFKYGKRVVDMGRRGILDPGLMSGTSMDGIDVAMIETDGENFLERPFKPMYFPYEQDFRKTLIASLEEAKPIKERYERPGNLSEVEKEITKLHAEAVRKFLSGNNLDPKNVDFIGFHGQTMLHKPEIGLTVQLGDGHLLADLTGINVVYDMRANDMLHGGQGAPLVPIYHQAMAQSIRQKVASEGPIVIVNIGGISNVTIIDDDFLLRAFDCGPGNALIDQWIHEKTGKWYDKGGKIAMSGKIDYDVMKTYICAEFFHKPPPRSLDRLDFDLTHVRNARLSLANGARTLVGLTAHAIIWSTKFCQKSPKLWVICGGGRKNQAIMENLKKEDKDFYGHDSTFVAAEDVGFDGDFVEAEAFAYLAVRSFKGLPLTFPTTTGCKEPVSGGILAKPQKKDG